MPLILLPNGSDYNGNGSTIAETFKSLYISFNSPLQHTVMKHSVICLRMSGIVKANKLDFMHRFF